MRSTRIVDLRHEQVLASCQTADESGDSSVGALGEGAGDVAVADLHAQPAGVGAGRGNDFDQGVAAADQVSARGQGANLNRLLGVAIAATCGQRQQHAAGAEQGCEAPAALRAARSWGGVNDQVMLLGACNAGCRASERCLVVGYWRSASVAACSGGLVRARLKNVRGQSTTLKLPYHAVITLCAGMSTLNAVGIVVRPTDNP